MSTPGVRGLGPGDRAAVLVSEMQRGIVQADHGALPGLADQVIARGVVAKVAELTACARAQDMLVVWCTIEPRPDRVGLASNSLLTALVSRGDVVAGSPAAAMADGLLAEDRDVVVPRMGGLTMFHGTELDRVLRSQGITTVILAGVSTDVGLTGAALEAVNRGYRVVLAREAAAGSSEASFERRLEEFFPLVSTIASNHDIAAALAAQAE